jgi:hypothetical protein
MFRHLAGVWGIDFCMQLGVWRAGISFGRAVFCVHAFVAYCLCLVLRRALLLLVRSGLRSYVGQLSFGVCLRLPDSHKHDWQLKRAQVWAVASLTGLIAVRFRLLCVELTSTYVCKEGCAASCRLRFRVPWCPAYSSQRMHCVCVCSLGWLYTSICVRESV